MLEKTLIALAVMLFAGGRARADAAPAPPTNPLREAFRKSSAQFDHWAFTETTHLSDDQGRDRGETVVRFDPSLPYAQQYTPITVEGRAPTDSDRRAYRKEGESRGKWVEKRAAEEAEGKPPEPEIDLDGESAIMDFDHAILIGQDAATFDYEVPLRPDGGHPLPVDRLRLTFRVTKASHEFYSATLKLLSPLRVKVVVRITKGQLDVGWRKIQPAYPPLIVSEHGSLAASILFLHFNGWESVARSDFKRVTPYRDRFGVKVGPLRALPF